MASTKQDYYQRDTNGYNSSNTPPRDAFVRGGQRATIHGTQAAKSWGKNKSKGKDKKDRKKKPVLYRSNSSLEMDSIDYIDVDEFHTGIHRDYGSTSSIDVLGKSGHDSFFALLKDYSHVNADQRSPAPAQLQELLRGKNEGVRFRASNGSAVKDKSTEDITDSPRTKSKFKHKDRKSRSKSITNETRPSGIFTKLRGKSEPEINPKTPDNIDVDVRAEERLRSKAFLHYDCQSITFNVEEIIHSISNPLQIGRNTTTGASAASQKDGRESEDEGDDKSNNLVLKCPFFRNEIGGEVERIVSLGRSSARRTLNKSKNTQNSAILTRSPACCGLSILDSSPTPTGLMLPHVVLHRNHVMEYVDHGASYYRHFFYGYDHQNFFGIDENFGPVAISIRREKLEDRENKLGKAEYGQYQHRIIFRTSALTTLRGAILEEAIPSGRISSSRTGQVKDILEFLIPQLQISCLKLGTTTPKTLEQLLKLDEQGLYSTYKVGVLLCRSGQSSEEDMYNNENSSPAFEEFLKCIGHKIRLKGFEKYRAQLDNKSDSTGTHSYYTTFNNSEIMFHVSTLLPYTANNTQQLLRKRHIGNDIVTIIFQEPNALPFSAKTVRSQFQHVFIIVRVHNPCSDKCRYSVSVSRSKDVPAFGPHIPENIKFPKSEEFAEFLLAKVINAENTAHKGEKFKAMATRTRTEYLKDLANNHVTSTTLESSSKLSKFGLGSVRKKEKTKQKVIPDMFSLGTTIWSVQVVDCGLSSQVEDCGLAMQVDSFLGISSEVLVVIEESSSEVIFTVHCGAIIGWTSQAMSIRIYFNQGESVFVKPFSGEMEETQEICERLTGVTSGCESQDMTLKRNGLGQLGFHVQNDGIVTDVESTGFAYDAGLRKGSRLVEVCKIAVATMTHEELVELLRTSVTVKVTVIPPFDDGTPRGVATLHTNCHSSSLKTLKAALQATENLQQWQRDVNGDLSHSREISSSSSETSYHLREITLSTKIRETDESGDNFRGSMTLPLQKKPLTPTRVDMKNSPFSIVTPQNRIGTSSLQRNTSIQHAYTDSVLDKNHFSSTEDIKHERSSSRDSSDYAYLISPTPMTRTKGSQFKFQGPSWANSSGDQSDHTSSMTSIYSATGYRKPNFSTDNAVQHGNIALELLKQSQNTKFLLNRGPEQPKSNNLSDTSFSSGSSGGPKNTNNTDSKEDVSRFRQKTNTAVHRTESPISSANSSPKTSHRNLYGTSSEESLNTRLRPGVTGSTKVSKSDNNFQTELQRLIDPELADRDLKGYLGKKSEGRYSSRLKRTMSDESLHNQKFNSGPIKLETHLTDVIFTTASPPQNKDPSKRQSPAVPAEDNQALSSSVPLPESTSGLEWSSLVSVATKAIEGSTSKSKPMETKPIKHDNVPIWRSVVANPQKRITELEGKVNQLEIDLAKETRENATLEEEVQELRAENARLQEESQQAAAQLRKFTEWFFKTIDRT
ncbi:signal-induced proliferation-associated 1-like protein 2 isoform X2 [Mytilus galloprovincialis]|uniref:signal-induced proliferation-associated 1-like protein 2 isoform X2 n=1 Tax=Mytilus galloprovincialis TaxID=29158 RepID=UPI003F7BC5E7